MSDICNSLMVDLVKMQDVEIQKLKKEIERLRKENEHLKCIYVDDGK